MIMDTLKSFIGFLLFLFLGIPVFIALFVLVSVVLWPVCFVAWIVAKISPEKAPGKIDYDYEIIEEYIFALYGFAALFLYLPLSLTNENY